VNLKIPLDQGFSGVFTDARSGERTPTGAVRRGLRPSPHRSRGDSGIGTRTVFTATSDRAAGLLREDGSNDESATVTGDRAGVGSDRACGHLRVTWETETCWSVRRCGETRHRRTVRRDDRARLSPSGDERPGAFGRQVAHRFRAGRMQRSRGEEPKELGPPQLDPARSVPNGARTEGSGNRVSVKRCHGFETGKPVSSPTRGIARHAARRDGRCEQVETKANARHSTSGGPVHSSSPGRRAGESPQRRPGRFRFPPGQSDTRPTSPKNAPICALSATDQADFGVDSTVSGGRRRGG
jgi:hypothetical protein